MLFLYPRWLGLIHLVIHGHPVFTTNYTSSQIGLHTEAL